MFMLLGIALLIGLIAGIAVGAAFVLESIRPQIPWKQRAWWAALGGGFIPMLLPLIAIATEGGFSSEGFIAIAAILVAGIIAALLVGFPAAYFFARARESARGLADPVDTFE